VAHDFNNILTVIIGFAKAIEMTIEPGDPSMVYVNQTVSSAEKAASLTQSLLAFSRKQTIRPSLSDLSRIVEGMERMVSRLITEDIELRLELCEGELASMVDENQIDQVIINLAANARDAMPTGGVLTIKTARVMIDDEFLSSQGYGQRGPYTLISFSDSGIGMDKRIQERILEPYFTTKEIEKGTGLGLSTVYGIVSQHQGYCSVESEPGSGARFDVYLPLCESLAVCFVPSEAEGNEGGSETLLLVEDADDVRSYLRAVLEKHGYTVLEAKNGREAVKQFNAAKDKIALYIIDAVMPKMNGKDVYAHLREMKPDILTVFISGHTRDIWEQKGISKLELNLISKPIRPADLLTKVREVFDDGRSE
jgi:two-component system, cell cycle sensor histidine kinase and response regulator CckA